MLYKMYRNLWSRILLLYPLMLLALIPVSAVLPIPIAFCAGLLNGMGIVEFAEDLDTRLLLAHMIYNMGGIGIVGLVHWLFYPEGSNHLNHLMEIPPLQVASFLMFCMLAGIGYAVSNIFGYSRKACFGISAVLGGLGIVWLLMSAMIERSAPEPEKKTLKNKTNKSARNISIFGSVIAILIALALA